MTFSGEIWVLNKLAELADRCGVSPVIANIDLVDHWSEGDEDHWYALSYVDGNARNEKEAEAVSKVIKLLGFDKDVVVRFPNLESVEEAVDRALALAPRARVRDR